MGAAESGKVSVDSGTETTLIGGITWISKEVGALATVAQDAMGPLETTDGCAKMSNLKTYGVTSVACDNLEYAKVTKEYDTKLTDSAAANSHLPQQITVKLDAISVEVTENTDTGGFRTACVLVKNNKHAVTAINLVKHGETTLTSQKDGEPLDQHCSESVQEVPYYMVAHDMVTVVHPVEQAQKGVVKQRRQQLLVVVVVNTSQFGNRFRV